jgi:hypothetical protein
MLEARRPADAVAIVVGIDHYRYGQAWQLAGPGSDALRCVDWLRTRGVKATKIALFLAARSWTDDAEVAAWVAKNKWKKKRPATQDAIKHFINEELSTIKADALFVYWGGHGVVDDRAHLNYLYTEDATEGNPYCVCTQDLMTALQAPRFGHLLEQVAVFDACANPYADTGESALPIAAALVRPNAANRDITQCQLFAASPGRRAANVSERRTGLFSQAYFAEIRQADAADGPDATKRWPDFIAAFIATLEGIEARELGQQQPFLDLSGPGVKRRVGEPPGASASVAGLLALVDTQTDAPPTLLYRLYLRSLADANRALSRDAGPARWLRDLDDQRQLDASQAPPLVEFAERLARELKQSDDLAHKALSDWVIEQTRERRSARTALRDALDAEESGRGPRATLFVEFDSQQSGLLHWWLQAPDPRDCSARVEIRVEPTSEHGLAEQLAAITAHAERRLGHRYTLAVGLVVPDTLLASGIESTAVAFEDAGLQDKPIPLNQRYPVTLHWGRRARARDEADAPINAWRAAVSKLKPRIKANGGADVVWLDNAVPGGAKPLEAALVSLLAPRSAGICLGLGHAASIGKATPVDIVDCLRKGVPCFFWLTRVPEGEPEVRKALCDAFAALKASEAPAELFERLKSARETDPACTVRLVWDEPGHLPLAQIFEAPSQGDAA